MKPFLFIIFILLIGLPSFADYNAQMELFQQQRQKYYTRQQLYQNKVLQNQSQTYQRQEDIRNRNKGLFEREKMRTGGYTGVHYYDY